jgi:hypothetical protein
MKHTSKFKNIILDKKSSYLKQLGKRKTNEQNKVNEYKSSLLIDRILGNDVLFKRNYAVFSYNKPVVTTTLQKGPRLYIKPNLQVNICSDVEILNPNKYAKKDFKADLFSQIYRNESTFKNNNMLTRAGSTVINFKRVPKNRTQSV